jgi:hypothetical protein
MKTIVIYESMYGNTHLVAEAIAAGLSAISEVQVLPVGRASAALLQGADLVVVGGPTHVHGVSRVSTRKAAVEAAAKPDSNLELDPDAAGPGLREWFATLDDMSGLAAAFDTRLHAPALVTGRASKGIARMLRQHGFTLVADPESFLVTKDNHLEPDEHTHARAWGSQLASAIASAAQPSELG